MQEITFKVGVLAGERDAREKRAPPADRGTRISPEFDPDPAIAIAEGMTPEQAARTAANFRDYWTAKPGAAGRKVDWAATWRVWCRREVEHRPARPPPKKETAQAYAFRMLEELINDDAANDPTGLLGTGEPH